jgi:hypothetical protein
MKEQPLDWTEFWIRFICSFLFFGFLFALLFLRFIDETGLAWGIGIWVTLTAGVSCYAARVGDEAWHKIIHALTWWW